MHGLTNLKTSKAEFLLRTCYFSGRQELSWIYGAQFFFIIVFKRARHLFLSQPDKSRPNHHVPVSLRSTLILSTNVRRQTPQVGPLLSDFPTKTLFAFLSVSYVQHFVPISCFFVVNYPKNIWCVLIKTLRLLTVQFSQASPLS